jgi:HSP20 family protein
MFQDWMLEMDRMTRDFSRVFDVPGCLMEGPETGLRLEKDVATLDKGELNMTTEMKEMKEMKEKRRTPATEGEAVPTRDVQIEPLADVYRNDNGVRLLVDLPGATEKDLDLQVHDGVLSLKARVDRAEHQTRVYTRAFRVDRRIDLDKIEAKIAQGVLTLHLPFRVEAQPKRIEVKSQP